MSEEKKAKFYNLGTMMQKKKKNPDDENEKKKFYIKLQQQRTKDGNVYGDTIFPITLANGKKLKDGDIITLVSKKEKLKKAMDDGNLSEEKYKELAAFLLFDVVVVDNEEGEEKDKDSIDF